MRSGRSFRIWPIAAPSWAQRWALGSGGKYSWRKTQTSGMRSSGSTSGTRFETMCETPRAGLPRGSNFPTLATSKPRLIRPFRRWRDISACWGKTSFVRSCGGLAPAPERLVPGVDREGRVVGVVEHVALVVADHDQHVRPVGLHLIPQHREGGLDLLDVALDDAGRRDLHPGALREVLPGHLGDPLDNLGPVLRLLEHHAGVRRGHTQCEHGGVLPPGNLARPRAY